MRMYKKEETDRTASTIVILGYCSCCPCPSSTNVSDGQFLCFTHHKGPERAGVLVTVSTVDANDALVVQPGHAERDRLRKKYRIARVKQQVHRTEYAEQMRKRDATTLTTDTNKLV